MLRKIAIVQGHPDPSRERFGRVLQAAYTEGAASAGHEVRVIDVATLDFPLLRTKADWEKGEPPPAIRTAQATIAWAEHLVFFYPLWAGSMPALLKGFIERILQPDLIARQSTESAMNWNIFKNKSARIVMTMGMPVTVYRWFYRGHALKLLTRNILHFIGIKPVRHTLYGMIQTSKLEQRQNWLEEMRALGRQAG